MFDTLTDPAPASLPTPGAVLAAVVDRALEAVTEHADVELRRLLVAAEQLTSWSQSASAAVIAEIARRDLLRQQELRNDLLARGEEVTGGMGFRYRMFADDPHRFLADEVATELAVSRGSAQHKVEFALTLEQYPQVAAAMRGGRLDRPKADAIAELLASVESDAFRDTLEQAAVEYGARHTRPQLRAWLRKRILAEEPQVAERRRQEAKRQRRVRMYELGDGMATVAADLPAETALAIYRTIDQLAHASCAEEQLSQRTVSPVPSVSPVPRVTADGRTMEQRRADVFADLLLARRTNGFPGTAAGGTAEVEMQVVVDAATLAAAANEPGELKGYGPITGEHAREIAGRDARWRRLLTDAAGSLLEVTPQTYRPSRSVARFVSMRDLTCRFPGCRRTPTTSALVPNAAEIDHTIPYPQGHTVPENLALLCKSHHLLKTHSEWRVSQDQMGVLTWVTPSGRPFRTYPHRYSLDRDSRVWESLDADPRDGPPPGQGSAGSPMADGAALASEPRSGAPPDFGAA